MTETNKAFVRRWFKEVWNEGQKQQADQNFTAGGGLARSSRDRASALLA